MYQNLLFLFCNLVSFKCQISHEFRLNTSLKTGLSETEAKSSIRRPLGMTSV